MCKKARHFFDCPRISRMGEMPVHSVIHVQKCNTAKFQLHIFFGALLAVFIFSRARPFIQLVSYREIKEVWKISYMVAKRRHLTVAWINFIKSPLFFCCFFDNTCQLDITIDCCIVILYTVKFAKNCMTESCSNLASFSVNFGASSPVSHLRSWSCYSVSEKSSG